MTITSDIRAIVERVKNLGPEWRHTANVLTDAMGAAEHAQNARLRYLTTCIDEAKGRLAYHKQEIRTLPGQIAKWEAERARLESQTGLDLLRAVVTGQGEKPSEPLYYLQDTRQLVGNCLLFWRENGAGYTTEIAEAGKYTAAQILERNPRDTDRIWPVSVIDAAVCGHVRTDNGSLSISQAVTLQSLKRCARRRGRS